MNTEGHLERAERFVNRPHLDRASFLARRDGMGLHTADYKSRNQLAKEVAYGQYADVGVKASLTVISATMLANAEAPLAKIVFGVTTVFLGLVTVASAFEAF